MPRGGARKGAGRPVGSIIDNPKVRIWGNIDQELNAWLKNEPHSSRVIEKALEEYKEKHSTK